jgi:transcriptional regulator with XRE-family HTH domain
MFSNMGTRKVEMGPAGHAVIANIRRIRGLQKMSLQELSDRLTQVGRPILPSGLSKIESGERRVDVDDLVAIAAALGVMPDRLLQYADGSQMDGFPGMTKDDYEDSVAVAGRLLRQVLRKMPEAAREEFEALRRSDEEVIRERDEAEALIRERDEALRRAEDV